MGSTADAGYMQYQEGLVQMLKALLIEQGRDPKFKVAQGIEATDQAKMTF